VPRRTPGAKIFTRDALSFLLGWGLIIYQGTIADPFNWTVFAGGLVVVLAPGAAAAWATRQAQSWTHTVPPSSDSPQEVASGPSP
jgi:hypothetical protein